MKRAIIIRWKWPIVTLTVSGGRKDEWTIDDERLKLSTKVTGDRSKMEKKKAVGCSGCSGASELTVHSKTDGTSIVVNHRRRLFGSSECECTQRKQFSGGVAPRRIWT